MAILLQINKLNYKINDDKIFDISLDVQKGDYISEDDIIRYEDIY